MKPSIDPREPWNGTVVIDRTDRARLWVGGPDRGRFLHNLTTNEVKRLEAGSGREAFVTSPQGKTLAFVIMHAIEDRILVRADPGGLEHALPHFQKYGALDDVELDDASRSTCDLHLIGPGPYPSWMPTVAAEPEYSCAVATASGETLYVIRESPTGFPGLTVITPESLRERILNDLAGAGATELEPERFEGLRIWAGTPVFGREVTPANLPQELGRDDRAISFIKGCYLGQETVARIDAVGHVNRILKGLRFAAGARVPAIGSRLLDGEKVVGAATSAAPSPFDGSPIALAFVKTAHAQAGTRLAVAPPDGGKLEWAVVADLPMTHSPPGAP